MKLITSESISVAGSAEAVWAVISDIPNAAETISGIKKVEVLEPAGANSLEGLKWQETREFMGKDATEVMWITAAQSPEFYETRAESHGAIYVSRMELGTAESGTQLTMSFRCQPVTFGARLMWMLTGWMAKGAMRKTIRQDLEDIRRAVESA